jgi:hypothetical protein
MKLNILYYAVIKQLYKYREYGQKLFNYIRCGDTCRSVTQNSTPGIHIVTNNTIIMTHQFSLILSVQNLNQ